MRDFRVYYTEPNTLLSGDDQKKELVVSDATLLLVERSAGMPFILDGDGNYLSDINRWLRLLPSKGCRSPETWKGYAYDVIRWLRFLRGFGKNSPWLATQDDFSAYHQDCVGPLVAEPLALATWNRSNAALESLYAFGMKYGLVDESPFVYRKKKAFFGEVQKVNATNKVIPKRPVRFLSRNEFARFLCEGLQVVGDTIPRNSTTYRLYHALPWLLVTTALRIGEALLTLAHNRAIEGGELFVDRRLRKWGLVDVRPHISRFVAKLIGDYKRLERTESIRRGHPSFGIDDPILVRVDEPGVYGFIETGRVRRDPEIGIAERKRMVVVDQNQVPLEPALLFLTIHGKPLCLSDAVGTRFRDAKRRLFETGRGFTVTPHDLRHTYAVHRLHQLTIEAAQQAQREDLPEPGSSVWTDIAATEPLRKLQDELGHSNYTSCLRYLNPGRSPQQFSWALESWPKEIL